MALFKLTSRLSAISRFFGADAAQGAGSRTYSIDDEEIDEPPVPIPSTWHDRAQKDEPNWIGEQLRASAYGFVIGMFVVIPAVMLLTGQSERLPSWQSVMSYAKTASADIGLSGIIGDAGNKAEPSEAGRIAGIAQAPAVVARDPSADTTLAAATVASNGAQLSTADTVAGAVTQPADQSGIGVVSGRSAETPPEAPEIGTQTAALVPQPEANVGAAPAPLSGAQPTLGATNPGAGSSAAVAASTGSTPGGQAADGSIAAARQIIRTGGMEEARMMLAKLASKGNSEAIFALAETFDPNVLAAWGLSGEEPNAEKAKLFYSMAQAQGIDQAQVRLNALQE